MRNCPIDKLAKLLAEQTSVQVLIQVLEALAMDLGPMIFHAILARLIRYLENRAHPKKTRCPSKPRSSSA